MEKTYTLTAIRIEDLPNILTRQVEHKPGRANHEGADGFCFEYEGSDGKAYSAFQADLNKAHVQWFRYDEIDA